MSLMLAVQVLKCSYNCCESSEKRRGAAGGCWQVSLCWPIVHGNAKCQGLGRTQIIFKFHHANNSK